MKNQETEEKAYTSAGKELLEGDKLFEKYLTTPNLIGMSMIIALSYMDKFLGGIENMFYPSIINKNIDRPIFIIGNFRSGTTLLEKIIAGHPKVGNIPYMSFASPLSIICTNLFFKLNMKAGLIKDVAQPAPHSGGMPLGLQDPCEAERLWFFCKNNPFSMKDGFDLLDADFTDPVFEKKFRSVINKCLYTQNKFRFLNKNPMNGYRLGYLAKIFPDALFVRIIRHPFMIVQSQIDLNTSLSKLIEKSKIFKHLIRKTNSLPGFPSTKIDHHFKSPQFEQFKKYFTHNKNLAIAIAVAEYEDIVDQMIKSNNLENRFYQLRYEDLINNYSEEAKKIFQFIDLYDEPTANLIKIQANELLKKEKTTELPPFNKDVKNILHPLLIKNGYSETNL